MNTIYVVDIESVPTRYTCHWKQHFPEYIRQQLGYRGIEAKVINISGGELEIPATAGAFLNFQQTNIYKNNQINQIAEMFSGEIKPGDHFIFADAWHPGIINLKYMSSLLNVPVVIHGLWHAGSYDPQDFLGRLVGNQPWVRHAEKSFFHAIDHNYFATDFHIDMFFINLLNQGDSSGTPVMERADVKQYLEQGKIVRTGWPMDYTAGVMSEFQGTAKRDMIIFPHRIAPEKQPEIFRDLQNYMPEYEFVVCQDQSLTKAQYHALLAQAKIVWSANLQETLGISPYEGAVLGALPLVPSRLSYEEMYVPEFIYPSHWTESFQKYQEYRPLLINRIHEMMGQYQSLVNSKLPEQMKKFEKFFEASNIINTIEKYKV